MNLSLKVRDCFSPVFSPAIKNISKTGRSIISTIDEELQFIRRFIKEPTMVGAIFPSSPLLAKKIVRFVEPDPKDSVGRHYLEVGPGTGSFTERLVKKIKKNDTLDVVEIDPTFSKILEKKFHEYPNVKVHCLSIGDWKPDYKYDAIVSGLPLNAFSPDQVQTFISNFKDLSKDGGIVSYFEYIGLGKIKEKCLKGESQKQFKEVLKIKKAFYETYGFKKDTVLINLPPARVLHFQVNKNEKAATAKNSLSTVSVAS